MDKPGSQRSFRLLSTLARWFDSRGWTAFAFQREVWAAMETPLARLQYVPCPPPGPGPLRQQPVTVPWSIGRTCLRSGA